LYLNRFFKQAGQNGQPLRYGQTSLQAWRHSNRMESTAECFVQLTVLQLPKARNDAHRAFCVALNQTSIPFHALRDGTFLELGALNGYDISNTFFFERVSSDLTGNVWWKLPGGRVPESRVLLRV
jgi:hypothetical protein